MFTRKRVFRFGVVTVVIGLVGWLYLYSKDTEELAMQPPRPHFHGERHGNKGVIVFVHGILGNGRSTWTHPTSQAYWPDLVRKDRTFDGFNIYIHEYFSPRVAPAPAIDSLADNMHDQFLDARIFDHDEVIFITHSMGGLVSRAFAGRYHKYAEKIKLLFFYATPTLGSDIANVFALLTRNPQVEKMKVTKGADYLADQLRGWINAGPQIPSYCAYEELPMEPLGMVVDIGSASALCGKRLSGITANHEDIAKPRDSDDLIYKVFRTAFIEVHQKVETWRIPPDMDLSQVIRTLATSENRTAEFGENCSRSLQRTKMLEGVLTGKNFADIIEQLPSRLTPQSSVSLRAMLNERGVYEIQCGL